MNSQKSGSMYLMWSGAIILCLALCLFALLFSSCSRDGSEPTAVQTAEPTADPAASEPTPPATAEPTVPVVAPVDTGALLGETEDAGQEFIDRLTFLGDSTTYGLSHYEVLSDKGNTTQVWTPSSGTLTLSNQSIATIVYPETGEEITIVQAVERKKPEYLVITLGVNGVSFMDEEYFKREYTALIDSVKAASPDTKIICNSIYPVMQSYQYYDQINNPVIESANTWVQAVAEACGVKYWDSASVLKDANGALTEGYCNGDGIHLNGEGFVQVLNYMRTHAYL